MNKFVKYANEDFTLEIDFAGRKPITDGATLSSGTVTAINLDTFYVDETILSTTTATVDGAKIKARVQGGKLGEQYLIAFTCQFSNLDTLKEFAIMKVI